MHRDDRFATDLFLVVLCAHLVLYVFSLPNVEKEAVELLLSQKTLPEGSSGLWNMQKWMLEDPLEIFYTE